MKIKFCLLLTLFMFSAFYSAAQTADSVVSQETERYYKYNYDNDFFSATDRYYTQGIRMELILPAFRHDLVSRLLVPLHKGAKKYYGIAFERDGFTPRSIRHDSIFYGERPYASVCFLSFFKTSLDKEKSQKLTSQIDLGVIGPNAKGEEEQKFIHKELKNIQPLGWQHQIKNDVVANYTVTYEKGFLHKKHIEFTGMLEARAGTLYDDASIGSTLRVGWMHSYFDDLGLSKNKTDKKFQCYLVLRGKVKAVGYNATMQGGLFNKTSPYTLKENEINRIVGTGFAGIAIAYKRVSIEYTKAYITREFYNGLTHGWGHCNITVCF